MAKSKYRNGPNIKRLTSVLTMSALVGGGVVAASGVTYAEEDAGPSLRTFDAADFADEAAQLPAGLRTAIERDLDTTPERYLANAEAAKTASEVADALAADGVGIASVAIDGQDVTLYVESEDDVHAAEAVGADVVVGEPDTPDVSGPSGQWSGPQNDPENDLKGGFGYMIYLDGERYTSCSVGFNGYAPDGGHRYLTAGHCGLSGPGGVNLEETQHLDIDAPLMSRDPVVINPEDLAAPIGEVVPGEQHIGVGVHHDGGIVDVTNPAWDNVPLVSEWGDDGEGNPNDGALTIYDSIDPVVGAEYCKSGFRTGFQCGVIDAAEFTEDWGGGVVVTGMRGNACGAPGDSGGSVVIGNYAVATVMGGSTMVDENGEPLPAPTCDDWDPEVYYNNNYNISGGTYNAFDLFGEKWELNVKVNVPRVRDVVVNDNTATLHGAVPRAGTDHRVEVSVSGAGDFVADVDANGEFTVEVDLGPDPQVYVYTAQTFYGDFSESAKIFGAFRNR